MLKPDKLVKYIYSYHNANGPGEIEVWATDVDDALAIIVSHRMFYTVIRKNIVMAPMTSQHQDVNQETH